MITQLPFVAAVSLRAHTTAHKHASSLFFQCRDEVIKDVDVGIERHLTPTSAAAAKRAAHGAIAYNIASPDKSRNDTVRW
jgi:hypothetical protein